jgi:hypothetical protein
VTANSQQRRDDSSLRRSFVPGRLVTLLILGRRFQPPFHVEHYPRLRGVLTHRPHHQVVRDVVEEALDIQVQHPVIPPAPLPGSPHRLRRGLGRPVSVAVRMKERVQFGFQLPLHHHLGHPIRHGRDA